jgi:UDP-glucuronate 4-epimerase
MVNIGEAQTIQLKEMIQLLEEGLGKKAILEYLPPQQGYVQATRADLHKARRLLKFDPGIGIKRGIQQFIKWYRQEGREMQA